MNILSIDIGGSHLKILCTGQSKPRKMASGKKLTPTAMVAAVKKLSAGWHFEVVEGRRRLGSAKWNEVVVNVASRLMKVFVVDTVVVGGGNAKQLDDLPHGIRRSHNLMAFRGGFRLWGVDDLPTIEADAPPQPRKPLAWRVV